MISRVLDIDFWSDNADATCSRRTTEVSLLPNSLKMYLFELQSFFQTLDCRTSVMKACTDTGVRMGQLSSSVDAERWGMVAARFYLFIYSSCSPEDTASRRCRGATFT
jgi:hypothetical protein